MAKGVDNLIGMERLVYFLIVVECLPDMRIRDRISYDMYL